MRIAALFNRQPFPKLFSILQFFGTLLFHMPAFLVSWALIILATIAYSDFFSRGNFSPALQLYLTGVAITTGLASVTFTYARVTTNSEKAYLTSIAELFLHGAMCLTISLLVSWVTSKTNNHFQKVPYLGWLLVGIFSSGQLFLILAARSLQRAIVDLERHLWIKVRQKHLWTPPSARPPYIATTSTSPVNPPEDL
jgi:hypothetical protein